MFSGLARVNTSATRSFSHSLTFGIELAVFTNMVQFAFTKTKRSRAGKPFWRKWGPCMCLAAATVLVLADLMRHLVNDAWGLACEKLQEDSVLQVCGGSDCTALDPKFNKVCYGVSVMSMYSSEGNLSAIGWMLTVFCTWSGFVLLVVGICWLLSLPQKVRAQWRALRSARKIQAHANSAPAPPFLNNSAHHAADP